MMKYLEPIVTTRETGSTTERMIAPLLEYARNELEHKIRRRRGPEYAIISSQFEKQLRRSLKKTGTRAIGLHFRAFEAASCSLAMTYAGYDADNLEAAFFEDYGKRVIALFRSFPVLGRVWSEIIFRWIRKVTEVINRAHADRPVIARRFFANCDPGRIRGIKFGISDPHNGGRETVILRFERGSVVYKPRCGDNERAWFALLRWINRQALFPEFRTLRVLCRGRYCWVEHVTPAPCRTLAQVKTYYRRAGGLLCITSLTGAIDCHCDNLIAVGDQPILVDTETLLHPGPSSAAYEGPAALLKTGLLPVPNARSDMHSYQVSGLGGTKSGSHVPTLNGSAARMSAHSGEIVRGFRQMWALLASSHARDGFQRQIRSLEQLRWRRVYYPTRKYIEIRNASLEPFALRSGLQRRRAIEEMLRRNDIGSSILRREARAIASLDVPYFTCRVLVNSCTEQSFSIPPALSCIRSVVGSV